MSQAKKAPGEALIRLCDKSRVIRRICSSLHLEQIAHDYFLMWHEAVDDTEKNRISEEYRKEFALALIVPFGVHASEVAALHFFDIQALFVLIIVIAAAALHLGGGHWK